MRPNRSPLVVASLVAVLVAGLAGCDRRPAGPDTYTWRGSVAPGAWVRVRNVNGSVHVARARGRDAIITATRHTKGRRPEAVRMIAEESGGGVVACAAARGTSSCDSRAGQRRNFLRRLFDRSSPTELDFVVALPAGARLDASTVNGRITVADAAGEVSAKSVNGPVTVGATVGPVRASTVNGAVLVDADSLAPAADVSLSSVNGAVGARVPSTVAAAIDLSTTNGRVRTDFPQLPITDNARRVNATLGGGGRTVKLHTVNGAVNLQMLR